LAILKYVACLIFLILIFNNIKEFSDYFTFQQDSAPAHRAKEMVDLLKRETPDFIPLLLWPSNSPDLNPVHYKIWGLLQQRVYSQKIQNMDELRQRIVQEWERLDQRVIDNAVKQWRRRLRSCVAANCEGRTFRASVTMCQSDSHLFNCMATLKFHFCQM